MAANSRVYSVLTSFGGFTHRGEDYHAAQKAYSKAVTKVQQDGEGSVSLLFGSKVIERFEPKPRRLPPWWRWFRFGRD